MVGTWILSREIAADPNYWRGIGNYNSHTPSFNQTYQQKVFVRYAALEKILGEY